MSGNVKCLRLQTQGRKNQVSKLMLGKFWFIYDFTDIDECKGNHHSCHSNATCTNTLGSHVCECNPGYTENGRNCTGEFNFLATYILCLE